MFLKIFSWKTNVERNVIEIFLVILKRANIETFIQMEIFQKMFFKHLFPINFNYFPYKMIELNNIFGSWYRQCYSLPGNFWVYQFYSLYFETNEDYKVNVDNVYLSIPLITSKLKGSNFHLI